MNIHQFHPGSAPGDAITNNMFEIQKFLQERGYKSRVFAEHVHPSLMESVESIFSYTGGVEDFLIIHHSMGFDCFDFIKNLSSRKILVYHNITPPAFFNEYNQHAISYIYKGKKQLEEYQEIVEFAFAVSEYNEKELTECGYTNTDILPILLDFEKYRNKTDIELYRKYQDTTNILFLGRIVPNKAQKDVIRSFYAYNMYENPNSRLFLVGSYEGMEVYHAELLELAEKLGIGEQVFIPGKVSFEELCTYYNIADVFLCLSEHEGFCVPILESFYFGVPVIAYEAAAIPYTMGDAGILLKEKDYRFIAALINEVVADDVYREELVERQRERLKAFSRNVAGERLLDKILEGEGKKRRSIQIKGPFENSYSLAVVNRSLALGLSEDKTNDVSLYASEGPGDYQPKQEDLLDKKEAWRLWRKSTENRIWDFEIRNMYPPRVHDMNGIYNLINFAWEESKVPESWVDNFNKYLDGIMVPSGFIKDVLMDSGVKVPIGVVPNGVELDILDALPYPLSHGKRFTFLSISSGFPRKGMDVLLKAYFEEFSGDDDVVLVIKTFPNIHNKVVDAITREKNKTPNPPQLIHICEDLKREEYTGLFKSSSCFVLPTRGEGFCIPAAEAMLAKMPVIITGYSGHMDFCDKGMALLVPYRLVPSRSHLDAKDSKWAEPDLEQLKQKMRYAFNKHGSEEIKKLVESAYDNIISNFTWKEASKKAALFLDKVEKQKPRTTRMGILTPWGIHCGIAEYSKYLVNGLYKKDELIKVSILSNDNTQSLKKANIALIPCWENKKDQSIVKILRVIRQERITTVVIQFNFAFFTLNALSKLINTLSELSVKVCVIFHAIELAGRSGKKTSLTSITDALKKADNLLLHNKADLEQFRKMGLSSNSSLFPHGVIPFVDEDKKGVRKKFGINKKSPIIASFGFMLPHKGFFEAIKSVRIIKKTYPDVLYMLLCSIHPDPSSKEYYHRCRELVKRLNLSENVLFFPQYLKEGEVISLLHAADIIVMPYKKNKESSSGAIKFALSALRPTIATEEPVFSDVKDCVYSVRGCSPEKVAEAVIHLLSDNRLRTELISSAKAYIKKHSFENTAEKLLKVCK